MSEATPSQPVGSGDGRSGAPAVYFGVDPSYYRCEHGNYDPGYVCTLVARETCALAVYTRRRPSPSPNSVDVRIPKPNGGFTTYEVRRETDDYCYSPPCTRSEFGIHLVSDHADYPDRRVNAAQVWPSGWPLSEPDSELEPDRPVRGIRTRRSPLWVLRDYAAVVVDLWRWAVRPCGWRGDESGAGGDRDADRREGA